MCRRWVFLPSLVCTVPLLVMVEGGDALQICLNTVAILFLCDIGETQPRRLCLLSPSLPAAATTNSPRPSSPEQQLLNFVCNPAGDFLRLRKVI